MAGSCCPSAETKEKVLAGRKKSSPAGSLEEYRRKRDFERTPEPAGEEETSSGKGRRFIVHKHHARSLHYDLRLEEGGVLRSWAVPKGPSLDPAQRRLAVAVEDHPVDYGDFEGVIPAGAYGAGRVIIWDRGFYAPSGEGAFADMLETGTAEFVLRGEKLRGGFTLIRAAMGGSSRNWLLIKKKDGEARPGSDVTAEKPLSVVSGLDVEDVEEQE